jgi:hypothetical protein
VPPKSVLDFLVAGCRPSRRDVLPNRVEKRWESCPATAIARANILLPVVAEVAPAERYPSGFRVEEADEEVRNGRLAAPLRADESHPAARFEA